MTSTDADVPECYKCPITYSAFERPVICTDGITYEEEAIYAHWGRQAIKKEVLTSPMTRQKITEDVIQNRALREAVEHQNSEQLRISEIEKEVESLREKNVQLQAEKTEETKLLKYEKTEKTVLLTAKTSQLQRVKETCRACMDKLKWEKSTLKKKLARERLRNKHKRFNLERKLAQANLEKRALLKKIGLIDKTEQATGHEIMLSDTQPDSSVGHDELAGAPDDQDDNSNMQEKLIKIINKLPSIRLSEKVIQSLQQGIGRFFKPENSERGVCPNGIVDQEGDAENASYALEGRAALDRTLRDLLRIKYGLSFRQSPLHFITSDGYLGRIFYSQLDSVKVQEKSCVLKGHEQEISRKAFFVRACLGFLARKDPTSLAQIASEMLEHYACLKKDNTAVAQIFLGSLVHLNGRSLSRRMSTSYTLRSGRG